MRKLSLLGAVLLIGVVAATVAVAEEKDEVADPSAADTVTEAEPSPLETFMADGSAYISGRYRYEYVDQDGLPENAKASTLRTRFGFESGDLYGFSVKLEAEDVSEVGDDRYNSTVNGRTNYPVVADPDGTELNEAWLAFSDIPDTVLRGGREALKLDNLRFIGDVGWRQNNQTFDGVNIGNESIEDLRLFYGYVGNVNRIFGEDSPVGDFNTNLHLINSRYSGIEEVTFTGYSYLLDVEDSDELSSWNVGARADGAYAINEELDLLYDAEYAYQEDYEDNPLSYNATYWRASTGVSTHGFTVHGGYESLGSDDGNVGFSTPFATLHKWNGWADKFLTTPADGLQDAYAGVAYVVKDLHDFLEKIKAEVIYHDFSSDEGSTDYGTEWDVNLVMQFSSYLSFGVKYANYDADQFATDTEKLIFSVQSQFHQ